jgi:hypothetical protein
MTSRRGFLGLLATVAAGATLDPERLLWVPGAKLISVPAPARSMADMLREIEEYVAENMNVPWAAYVARKAAFGVSEEMWLRRKMGMPNWHVAAKTPAEDAFIHELGLV